MERYESDGNISGEGNNLARETSKLSLALRKLYKLNWLLLALLSACLYAVVALFSSTLAGEIDSFFVTFSRTALSTILAAIVACYDGSSLTISSKTDLRFHLVQSILTTVNLFCLFYAYQHMPASDANTIIYSQVILVGMFGRFIYKEPFGIVELITVCTAAVGIVLISRPSFLFGSAEKDATASVVPPLIAVIACVTGALSAVHGRAMEMRNITGMSLMFYSMLFSSLILAVPLTISNQWNSLLTVCVGSRTRLIVVSISAFMANSLYNYALLFENTVYVALVVLNNILVVFVISVIFFGFTPIWTSVVGMVIILGSCACVSLKRIIYYRNQTNSQLDSTTYDNLPDEV